MKKNLLIKICCGVILWFPCNLTLAKAWLTGPLLAPSGKNVAPGHIIFQPFAFYTKYPRGYYNLEGIPIIIIGATNYLDVQIAAPIDFSWTKGRSNGGIGDYSVGLGLQLLKQSDNPRLFDARLLIQEVIPSGKYDHLDPAKLGTDQTGIGSYQTFVSLNMQKLFELPQDHYFRSRLSLITSMPSNVRVKGFNVFGGGPLTDGIVNPESSFTADLALEYTLTQRFVSVFEVIYVHSSSNDFDGNPGFTPGGTIAGVGDNPSNQISIAPALEYNFTDSVGIIGGVWFLVSGPESAKFASAVFSVYFHF